MGGLLAYQYTCLKFYDLSGYQAYTFRQVPLYAEIVCRKCGERGREERQSHLDTSTTPVCPLFLQYVHSLVDVRV